MSDQVVYTDSETRTIYFSQDVDNKSVAWANYSLLQMIEKDNEKDKKEKDFERKPIKLYLNTRGGYVCDMWSTVDIIQNSKTPIYTYCTGYAMSCGFLMLIAGHKRFMTKHAEILFHSMSNCHWGTYQDLKESFEHTKLMEEKIENFVTENTKISQFKLDEIREKKFDWYMDANEALSLGCIDEIIT